VIFRGRGIAKGQASGKLLISPEPISFLSGVDPETGVIVEKGHPLEGQSMAGRVIAFDHGKGSTVGSYVLYALSRNGHAPAAIINTDAEPIIIVGAIMGGIPMIDTIGVPLLHLRNGAMATVNGDTGELTYEDQTDDDCPQKSST
jgi:phosphomecalonate degydratase small subunit